MHKLNVGWISRRAGVWILLLAGLSAPAAAVAEIMPLSQIRPGMTANIRIPVASADRVVAVPLAAVYTDIHAETGVVDRYVFVQRDGKYERRAVQIGVSDLFYAEVQNGLSAGETVALEVPQSVLEKTAATAAVRPGAT